MPLLSGKTGLIVGIANERSYAWHIAKSLSEHGARCAFTHLPGEKNERRTRRALTELGQENPWLALMDAAKNSVEYEVYLKNVIDINLKPLGCKKRD